MRDEKRAEGFSTLSALFYFTRREKKIWNRLLISSFTKPTRRNHRGWETKKVRDRICPNLFCIVHCLQSISSAKTRISFALPQISSTIPQMSSAIPQMSCAIPPISCPETRISFASPPVSSPNPQNSRANLRFSIVS